MANVVVSLGDLEEISQYDSATSSILNVQGEGAPGQVPYLVGTRMRFVTPGGGGGSGIGDVSRSGSTQDNRLARWDLTTATIQTGVVTEDDSGNLTGVGTITGGSGNIQITNATGNIQLAAIEPIATSSFLGRSTAGTGAVEVLSVATAKTLLDLSGTNTGDQTITLSGDVSGTGTGAITTVIGALKVTNAMLAGSIAASKLVGTDIATVGTITLGTWNGTTIAVGFGGTGLTAGTSGGVPYYASTSTMASSLLLAANAIMVGGGAATAPKTQSNLTFDNTTLALTGAMTISSTLGVTGVATLGSASKASASSNGGEVSFKIVNSHATGGFATFYLQPTSTAGENTQFYRIGGTNGGAVIVNTGTGDFTLGTNNTTRVTIAGTGAVTIATGVTLSSTLDVVGVVNSTSNLQIFRSTGGTSNANAIWTYNDTLPSLNFRYATTITGSLSWTGTAIQMGFHVYNKNCNLSVPAGAAFISITRLSTTTCAITLGNASTDLITVTGRLLVRSVTDAGPMTATPGTQREIVYNTSNSKFYGCTVTHATAATWSALN